MNKVYEIVKDRVMSKLLSAQESGERFYWVKPWNGGCPWACNYVSEKPYRGINAFLLEAGEYLTFNQIKGLQQKNEKIHLEKGSSHLPVFFFKFKDEEEEESNATANTAKRTAIFRYYRVFSINDVRGLTSHFSYTPQQHTLNQDMQHAQEVMSDYATRCGVSMVSTEVSARAYYTPGLHSIHLPVLDQFESAYEYFSTCFHELVHSTAKALGRDLPGPNCLKSYALEELVAEMGAAMLCAKLRIVDDCEQAEANSVAYLQSWISQLEDEPGTAIASAANKAQKACDLICNELAESTMLQVV